jgi:hypothetical protein
MAHLDLLRGVAHVAGGVFEKDPLLRRAHKSEKQSRLCIVIIVVLPEIPLPCRSGKRKGRILVLGLLLPLAVAVGLVAYGASRVGVDPHLPVPVVAVHRAPRRVYRDLVVVHAEAVPLGVSVGEQPSL